MSERELRDQLVTMLAAGHETTSTSIAWAIERLVRHPDIVADLRAEFARGDTTLLDAVIKETLRSRPVVPQVARYLTEPTEIDGCLVPAGIMVMIPMSVIHMDPEVYPEPQAFRPERFLDGNVRHRGGRRGTVPVPDAGWKPDDIAGSDLLDGTAFDLHPAAASRDNEPLAERMRMPGRPGTRLERDAGCTRTSGSVWVEQGINANGAGEPIRRSFDGGL